MFLTILLLVATAVLVGAMLFHFKTSKVKAGIAGLICLIISVGQAGFFYVPQKHSGHVTQKLGEPLKNGQLIAFEGQRGEQADLLSPGWDWDIRYPWVMDIEMVPDLDIGSGKFAILKARDGQVNPEIVAPFWGEELDHEKMLQDVSYFMENGGSRGVQQNIVTTGNYRINQFQWTYQIQNMTNVNSTEVLVIESKFGKSAPFTETSDDEILSVPLVESEEYRGIVDKALASGMYPIHPYTQQGHSVPIVLQTFIYGGGYESKTMDLAIDPENDKLITKEDSRQVPSQKHGDAFPAKTKDNHTVYIDVRVLGQIEPIQAPRFIGTIKDTSKLDDQIIEPYTKNILTNLVLKYDALSLKDKKEELGEKLSDALRDRTQKTGFRTKTVEITNIDIPPIVLISAKISSASDALKDALVKKEASVRQAIKVRNMQDQADNQEELAMATVANAAAVENAAKIKKLADANLYKAQAEADAIEYRFQKEAAGMTILAKSIGEEAAASLLLQGKINEAAEKFNVPGVYVNVNGGGQGDGGNFDPSTIVGAHMVSKSISETLSAKQAKAK